PAPRRHALSPFPLKKPPPALAAVHPGNSVTGIAAAFWHFVELDRDLAPAEHEILERLLTYGPHDEASNDDGTLTLSVPRPGTISPWSSKATDIARNCGLAAVRRIERGIGYRIVTRGGMLDSMDRGALLPLLHDRMTEAILDSLDDSRMLFAHVAPRPMTTIPLLAEGRVAIERANAELGLALRPDGIGYPEANFRHAGRDPTDVELMVFAQANSEHCRHKIFSAGW